MTNDSVVGEDFGDGPPAPAPAPEAPHGYRKDGAPAGRPGRPPGRKNTAPASRPAPAPKPTAAAKPRTTKPKGRDYRSGIRGCAQVACLPLVPLAQRDRRHAANLATITSRVPKLAEDWNEAAQIIPEFAAVLDKLLALGPWALVLAEPIAIVAQIATNMGYLPAEAMGTQTVDEILGSVANPETAAA